MKRDMDLVRKLVLALEDHPAGYAPPDVQITGYTEDQIGYHLYIMMQAGLIVGVDVTTHGSTSPQVLATSLTWAGHEFADAARDSGRWNTAVELIRDKAGSATLEVLMKLLTRLISSSVGL